MAIQELLTTNSWVATLTPFINISTFQSLRALSIGKFQYQKLCRYTWSKVLTNRTFAPSDRLIKTMMSSPGLLTATPAFLLETPAGDSGTGLSWNVLTAVIVTGVIVGVMGIFFAAQYVGR